MKYIGIICLLFALLPASFGFAEDRILVFVSILPQKYFVERIGGERVNVEVMVLPGASPATYEPKPSQMRKLAMGEVYYSIGVPFEHAWLERIAGMNRDMEIVHTDDGIDKIPITGHHHDGDEAMHGEHEEAEQGLDPHIWLSPPLVKKQATVIFESLCRIDGAHAGFYEKNYKKFISDIDRLHGELQDTLQDVHKEFMVFHPSWGYFAKEYGLVQLPVEVEGKEPKPAQLKKLIVDARKAGIKVLFVQPQFSQKSAKLIAREIDGEVMTIDPLAENWLENLKEVAETFKATVQEGP